MDKIAAGILYRTAYGLPLDESILAARDYMELTAERVREAFARWLRVEDLVQVTSGRNQNRIDGLCWSEEKVISRKELIFLDMKKE